MQKYNRLGLASYSGTLMIEKLKKNIVTLYDIHVTCNFCRENVMSGMTTASIQMNYKNVIISMGERGNELNTIYFSISAKIFL